MYFHKIVFNKQTYIYKQQTPTPRRHYAIKVWINKISSNEIFVYLSIQPLTKLYLYTYMACIYVQWGVCNIHSVLEKNSTLRRTCMFLWILQARISSRYKTRVPFAKKKKKSFECTFLCLIINKILLIKVPWHPSMCLNGSEPIILQKTDTPHYTIMQWKLTPI